MWEAALEYLHRAPFAPSSIMPQIHLGLACEFSSRQVNKLLNLGAIKKIWVKDNKMIAEASLPCCQDL